MQTPKTPDSAENPKSKGANVSGASGFQKLLELAQILRGPEGCPWDREQTVTSLAPFLVEESYEVLHACLHESSKETVSELGDVAFVLALTLTTAEQEGLGSLDEVLCRTDEKIRSRHPHIFAGLEVNSSAELQGVWEQQKRREAKEDPDASVFHLPKPAAALPGLLQAQKLQLKAARWGFDWPDIEPVFAKVEEELGETRDAVQAGSSPEIEEEVGDLLFSVVNLARNLGLDAESALRSATTKFQKRFNTMIDIAENAGADPGQSDLVELDRYWEEAKRQEKER